MARFKLQSLSLPAAFVIVAILLISAIPPSQASNEPAPAYTSAPVRSPATRAFSGAGAGTVEEPYVITNVNQLQEMRNDLGANYTLGNDIDAIETMSWNDGEGFEPIGKGGGIATDRSWNNDYRPYIYNTTYSFTGSLDGKNHTIENLYINRPNNDEIGLFGQVHFASIKNISMLCNITGRDMVGGLIGSSDRGYSTFENCYSIGRVVGEFSVGGLIGRGNGHFKDCSASTVVFGKRYVGGLIGESFGTIINCRSSGTVNLRFSDSILKNVYVGGLIGDNDAHLLNCISSSIVYAKPIVNQGNYDEESVGFGGLIGRNNNVVENCGFTGEITSNNNNTGGLVGIWTNLYITSSYVDGNVTGTNNVGGLIGVITNKNELSYSFSKGNVKGSSHNQLGIGGLIGLIACNGNGGGGSAGYDATRILKCYSLATSSSHEFIGGFEYGIYSFRLFQCYSTDNIAYRDEWFRDNGHIYFFDKDSSTAAQNQRNGAKTLDDLKHRATFSGWNFTGEWDIIEGVTTPFLRWEPRDSDGDGVRDSSDVYWNDSTRWKAEPGATDSDNDGFPDNLDAFPTDPADAVDTDKDGSPDKWVGDKPYRLKWGEKETTNLHIDAFPLDPAASVDSDCDNSPDFWNSGMGKKDSTTELHIDKFPKDVAASEDSDNDGRPNRWNPDMTEEDSYDNLFLDHEEKKNYFSWIPVLKNPNDSPGDRTFKMFLLSIFGGLCIICLICMAVIIVGLKTRKKNKATMESLKRPVHSKKKFQTTPESSIHQKK